MGNMTDFLLLKKICLISDDPCRYPVPTFHVAVLHGFWFVVVFVIFYSVLSKVVLCPNNNIIQRFPFT